MLSNDLNLAREREAFLRRGRHQVRDFLQPRAADALLACLRDEVPWTLAMHRDGKSQTVPVAEYQAMDEAARRTLVTDLAVGATDRYGFAYESYQMIQAVIDGRDPGLLLHRITEYLHSPEFLAFARTLTGFPQIQRVSAQATRYRAGHFLRMHDDLHTDEGRLVAYVMNLTPLWNSDFGGLLNFIGPDGAVSETFYPWFNSLSVFRVPQSHFVSVVAPFASADRYAITGWFRT